MINPGTVVLRDEEFAHEERLVAAIPLGRIGEPSDVADAVVYLFGAEYVSGSVLGFDGGAMLR